MSVSSSIQTILTPQELAEIEHAPRADQWRNTSRLINEIKRLATARLMAVLAGTPKQAPQLFALHRNIDVTGISGTGLVALGVEFPDGQVVIRWGGDHKSTVIWPSLSDALSIHSHDGKTVVIWLTEELETLAEAEERADRAEEERDRLAAELAGERAS